MTKYKLALIAIAIMALIVLGSYPYVMALGAEETVTVTASVAVNCTSSTHMYEEECLQRFVDHKEDTRRNLDNAYIVLRKAQVLFDTAYEADRQADDMINTFINGI